MNASKPTPPTVTADDKARNYVIKTSSGYSCLGYDNCFNHVKQLADILNQPEPQESERGTLALYARYGEIVHEYGQSPKSKETYFDPKTSPEVKKVLEDARNSGRRVRWFYGEADSGRSWLEENDVEGTIGRSMGPLRSPLGICQRSDLGGGALLTACIVRIIDAKTKDILYSHPKFHLPPISFKAGEQPGYAVTALVNGEVHARFKKKDEATKWVNLITGAKPGAVSETHIALNNIAPTNDTPLPGDQHGTSKGRSK